MYKVYTRYIVHDYDYVPPKYYHCANKIKIALTSMATGARRTSNCKLK